jgi:hypothetical protein
MRKVEVIHRLDNHLNPPIVGLSWMQYFMGTHRPSFSEEVLQKTEQLRSMGAALKLFGAGAHRYRFNPPLEPEVVAAFEASQALRLPEDYRDFILNVGNGGAGPCYGIYPLLPEGSIHHGRSNKDHARIDLSVPFPHAGDWDADRAVLTANG